MRSMPEEVEAELLKSRKRQWISSYIDTLPFAVASCLNSPTISTKRRHNIMCRESSPFHTNLRPMAKRSRVTALGWLHLDVQSAQLFRSLEQGH